MGEHHTYKHGSVAFTLTREKIIIRTSLQTFFLLPRQSYWVRRLNTVRAMIELGEISDLNDLAAFCGTGIEWRATALTPEKLLYYESKHEQATAIPS